MIILEDSLYCNSPLRFTNSILFLEPCLHIANLHSIKITNAAISLTNDIDCMQSGKYKCDILPQKHLF